MPENQFVGVATLPEARNSEQLARLLWNNRAGDRDAFRRSRVPATNGEYL
jgi:hypothetical protein